MSSFLGPANVYCSKCGSKDTYVFHYANDGDDYSCADCGYKKHVDIGEKDNWKPVEENGLEDDDMPF